MGKNCRLQNETLANPIQWGFRYAREENMEKDQALAFMQGLKDDKADALHELEKVVAARPNISDRYINYLKGHYDADMFCNLMQGRYHMKNRQQTKHKIGSIPPDMLEEEWTKLKVDATFGHHLLFPSEDRTCIDMLFLM